MVGAEVHLWSELTDPVNLEGKLWPRASVAAEVLWSGPPIITTIVIILLVVAKISIREVAAMMMMIMVIMVIMMEV